VTFDGHVRRHQSLSLLRRKRPTRRNVNIRIGKYLNNIVRSTIWPSDDDTPRCMTSSNILEPPDSFRAKPWYFSLRAAGLGFLPTMPPPWAYVAVLVNKPIHRFIEAKPMLVVIDTSAVAFLPIPQLIEAAHKHHVQIVLANQFATELGAAVGVRPDDYFVHRSRCSVLFGKELQILLKNATVARGASCRSRAKRGRRVSGGPNSGHRQPPSSHRTPARV